jgi:hypothetical protein
VKQWDADTACSRVLLFGYLAFLFSLEIKRTYDNRSSGNPI